MTTNETTRTSSARKPIWVAGLMLWILIALLVAAMLWVRSNRLSVAARPSAADTQGPATTASPTPNDAAAEYTSEPDGLEDFQLIERSGRTVTKADLLGRPWAVCFIFTRCAGQCPRVTAQMRLLHDRLKRHDVRLVSLSVDPEFDTPEMLSRYADQYGADPDRWLFLTGDRSAVYHLIRYGFQLPVKETQGTDRKPGFEVVHSKSILHVDASGRIVGKYDALKDTDMVALRRALIAECVALEREPAE